MKWNELKDEITLEKIEEESHNKLVLIFKHSIRCSLSAMAMSRLERSWKESDMKNVMPYYLDLIRYRTISNALANKFGVMHQSPQVLVIKNGKCIYNDAHLNINYEAIKKLSFELSVN